MQLTSPLVEHNNSPRQAADTALASDIATRQIALALSASDTSLASDQAAPGTGPSVSLRIRPGSGNGLGDPGAGTIPNGSGHGSRHRCLLCVKLPLAGAPPSPPPPATVPPDRSRAARSTRPSTALASDSATRQLACRARRPTSPTRPTRPPAVIVRMTSETALGSDVAVRIEVQTRVNAETAYAVRRRQCPQWQLPGLRVRGW